MRTPPSTMEKLASQRETGARTPSGRVLSVPTVLVCSNTIRTRHRVVEDESQEARDEHAGLQQDGDDLLRGETNEFVGA